jgi:class 3 adenylate cyclase/tetratricopeptide (TPR) repeat protein
VRTGAACEACGAALPARARFCPECGRPVREAAGSETRRVITALFFDTVGSTALGERLDPEDLQLVIGAGVDRMVAAAEAFGGSARTPEGDGGLVLFGAPVAHEDDPERAVRAALRIVDEMAAYAEDVRSHWGIAGLGVRVGVETGLVALSSVGGAGGTGAMGDALNTAARLQAAAGPGEVLIGERTRRAVSHLFEWEGPRGLELKGKAGTVPAWRAVAAVVGAPRRLGVRAPLVGRDDEIARGFEAADAVISGAGRVVVVRGRAGLGKTRMLEELRIRFTGSGGRWLEGRAASYGEALALHPFAELFAGVEGAAEALAAPTDVPAPLGLGRVAARVAALLRGLAGATPVAVSLDDLHWADRSSLAVAERLLDLADHAPVLLVFASRPEPQHASTDLLRAATARPGTLLLDLAGLQRDDERRLLAQLFEGRAVESALTERLLDRAEGNPFYLEELALAVGDTTGPDALELPASIEKLVLARVDTLDPAVRSAAAAAAVLGRAFDVGALETMVELVELEPLLDADLVVELGGGRYTFRHPLIQEAIYSGLLRRRRQELHRIAATALLGRPPAVLARHHALAGDDGEALDAYLAAAAESERQGALTESRAHAGEALAAAERLGIEDTDPRVISALRVSAVAAWYLADVGTAEDHLRRALGASRSAGDLRAELEALTVLANFARFDDYSAVIPGFEAAAEIAQRLGDGEALVNALARMAIAQVNLADLAGAADTVLRAHEAAEHVGTRVATGAALDAEKLIALHLGEVDRLEQITDRLLELVRPAPDGSFPDTYGLLRYQFTLLERAFVPLARGDLVEARRRASQALAENERSGMSAVDVPILDAFTWIARAAGDRAGAVAAARWALASAERVASTEWIGWCGASLGAALIEDGGLEEAARVLVRGLDAADRGGALLQVLRCAGLLAAVNAGRGDEHGARAAANRALAIHDQARTPRGCALLFAGDALLALSRALRALGEDGAAERVAVPVLRAAERTGWWLPERAARAPA